MKQETNNEMDLLLRRLGRRPETSVSDGNGDIDHLDADELSAYAENVLPAAARARYTTHLAECARCRELVVQLSSSAGVVPLAEVVKPSAPSALRKFLASLFSPMVLRYAVPALGLILVAAIGLFVLRPKQGPDTSIAQRTEAPTSTSITATTPDPNGPAAKTYYDQDKQEAAAGKPAQTSGPTGNQPAAVEAPAIAGRAGDTSRDEPAKKEVQQPVTNEAPAPPAPKPTPASEESKRPADAEARREAPSVQVAAEPPTAKTADVTAKVEDRKTAAEVAKARADGEAGRAQTFGAASAGVVARSRTQAKDDAEKDKQEAGETRTIAGRHFRKKDNTWIDTAYDSSKSVTTYTRGSEAYRSLTADEPAIKTIAEKLDGEVIVVWKGRTYRIR
jgi:hypothetical protein